MPIHIIGCGKHLPVAYARQFTDRLSVSRNVALVGIYIIGAVAVCYFAMTPGWRLHLLIASLMQRCEFFDDTGSISRLPLLAAMNEELEKAESAQRRAAILLFTTVEMEPRLDGGAATALNSDITSSDAATRAEYQKQGKDFLQTNDGRRLSAGVKHFIQTAATNGYTW